ncbi:hypothetical protein NC99_42730 [Sunxiuqinia dokdonensis]|uniref:Uncharacterized protein n=1 Tax=Sunxiuqinia dokdonensis TaxID=1409788 RepID=A0A0L8V3A0_9BACT|nr:hypothetical protein NC99_42730 [Sunxiuqinia dokdonensis]
MLYYNATVFIDNAVLLYYNATLFIETAVLLYYNAVVFMRTNRMWKNYLAAPDPAVHGSGRLIG